MLQMPPWMVQRQTRRAADARRGRLADSRRKALVDRLAISTRLALEADMIATKFGLEAAFRYRIRSILCLQGWPWPAADRAAREILDAVFARLCAARPSWDEGQPEWAQKGASASLGRMGCARCRKALPPGHHKFCGKLCADAYHAWMERLRRVGEDEALDMAIRYDGASPL